MKLLVMIDDECGCSKNIRFLEENSALANTEKTPAKLHWTNLLRECQRSPVRNSRMRLMIEIASVWP